MKRAFFHVRSDNPAAGIRELINSALHSPSPAQREDSLVRAQAMSEKLKGTAFENIPLIGSLSQVGGLSDISDDCRFQEKIRRLYE